MLSIFFNIISAEYPIILTIFVLDFNPPTIVKEDVGIDKSFDKYFTRAWFAFPFTGGSLIKISKE